MTIQHAYLIALLKTIKRRMHNADLGAGRSSGTDLSDNYPPISCLNVLPKLFENLEPKV
ncbi:Hypothetical protein CINCED_3A021455 [Cinara cedri]|uniref:Uncharacterized protein n=1 Tax=Cinara cedri TaxID=506608 RepID=A0A5E4MBP9_9HEMI|nr:Hypothetical protein CINCED_3A021455 [Cinara cedri]